MKRLKYMLTIIVLVTVVAAVMSSFTKRKETVLKLDLKKGRTYEWHLLSEVDGTINGQVEKSYSDKGYGIDVKEVRGDEIILDYYFTRMKFITTPTSDEPDLSFDSEKGDTASALGRVFSSIKGYKLHVVMSSEGVVKEVIGGRELYNQLIKKYSQADVELYAQYFGQVSGTKIKEHLEQVFQFLPYKSVKVGDSWTKEFRPIAGMPVKTYTTYKVLEIRDDKVILDAKGTYDPDLQNSNAQEMKVKGDLSATMEILKDSGFPVKYETRGDLQIKKEDINLLDLKLKSFMEGQAK